MTAGHDTQHATVTFIEYGTHKLIRSNDTSLMTGQLRLADQKTIDALRDAFEAAGWKVIDRG